MPEPKVLPLWDAERDRPLVVTTDAELLDDLLRIAAAAGVEPEVVDDLSAVRRPWQSAPLVVVGADVGPPLRRAALSARAGIILVGRDDSDIGVWRSGFELGATRVLCLPADEAELSGRFADAAEGAAQPAPLLAVIGGCGGAGASTLAVGLALAGTRARLRTTLVDADPRGGGLDLLLGSEDEDGLRWSALATSRGRVSGAALHAAMPQLHGVRIVSCDPAAPRAIPPEAMSAVLDAARRVSDAVVVDLPRHVDKAVAEVLSQTTVTLLVLTADVRAVAAAGRVVDEIRSVAADVQAVVRVSARAAALTGDLIAGHLEVPLAGTLANERNLDVVVAHGQPPGRSRRGPLGRLCDRLVDEFVRAPREAIAV